MCKTLVAYFSASGTTARVAVELAQAIGADSYEIKPAIPYTKADLNWTDKQSRSTLEMTDKGSRPALADRNADIQAYDTILLGFPIWWYTAPRIVSSFLEQYDFSGKRIILFATSGGSGLGKTAADLSSSVSASAKILDGGMLNGSQTADKLKAWAAKVL